MTNKEKEDFITKTMIELKVECVKWKAKYEEQAGIIITVALHYKDEEL